MEEACIDQSRWCLVITWGFWRTARLAIDSCLGTENLRRIRQCCKINRRCEQHVRFAMQRVRRAKNGKRKDNW